LATLKWSPSYLKKFPTCPSTRGLLCRYVLAGRKRNFILKTSASAWMLTNKPCFLLSLLLGMYWKKANIIYHRLDMSLGTHSLLQTIWKIPELPMVVLFQHPCQTKSRDKLSRSASDCFPALSDYFIDSVHFVYDSHVNPNKNCSNYQSMMNVLTEDCSLLVLSHIKIYLKKLCLKWIQLMFDTHYLNWCHVLNGQA
jgi:hypothetical protein